MSKSHRRSQDDVDMDVIRTLRSTALLTPCLLWTGSVTQHGYPRYRRGTLREKRVTRMVLEKKLGRPLAPNMLACHHCDNPLCIEPEHLFEATHLANTRDMVDKGRSKFHSRKPGRYWSKLTEAEVRIILSSTDITQDRLAKKFGVSQSLINAIKTRKVWRDIHV
jgi:hypothetical protein